MATVAISGKSGSVTNAGGASEVKEWSGTIKVVALDATSMDSLGWEEFIEGLQGCAGSFTCIGAKPDTGAVSSLTLNTGNTSIAGNAIISEVEWGTPVDGVVTYSANFVYTGVVTA